MTVIIDLTLPWDVAELRILRRIVLDDGTIRRSKPPINDVWDSYAAYVWRMIGFTISEQRKLQCMPIMCWYDLIVPDEETRSRVAKELDKIVDRILSTIPVSEWHGIRRWMGLI